MTERVKHSGPDTKFCVLCLSGEHERIEDRAPTEACPNCGPTLPEPHPRLPVQRCSNCKEHLRAGRGPDDTYVRTKSNEH
jgi:hypothetical protein